MLTCPKCNYDNELGRIFCHQCGTKLDLNQIKASGHGGKSLKRRDSPSVGRIVLRVVEVAVVAVILWGTYLMWQVPDVKPVTSTAEDQSSAEKKRLTLERAIDQRKAATIQLSEAEANSYLERLGFEKGDDKSLRIAPTSIQIEFEQGAVGLVMLGQLEIGGAARKKIYLKCRGVVSVEHGELTFKPVAAVFGAVPIHPRILESTSFMQHHFSELIRNLQEERKLLGKLTAITVEPHRVLLTYEPPANAK